ncbi:fungal-specific transcription factor domain-containing protein [Phyllosticta citriasiana]|uniref:Fungal-specific transcription factor domain-containing protein n=1 Tax=Phyllosticta citriasiana TaxID=595635 RepID=A0ABR1KUB4_9PEZI
MADPVFAIGPPQSKVTRVRPQLSCIPCRKGKLKCNRAHPACDQCVKRSREPACNYVPPPPKEKGRKAKDMRSRIRHLEALVVDLMNGKDPRSVSVNSAQSAQSAQTNAGRLPTPDQTVPDHHKISDGPKTSSSSGEDERSFPSACGALKISENESTYTGSSHWTAVLRDLSEVKNLLESDEDDDEDEDDQFDPEPEDAPRSILIVGSPPPVTRLELLQNLPPRDEVERLVMNWRSAQDPATSLLHPPTFLNELARFWVNPDEGSTMWISFLYGLLSLGSLYILRTERTVSPQHTRAAMKQAKKFRSLAGSAAVLADFAKPKPYTLEALLVYAACEYLLGESSPTEVWHVFGSLVRCALRMGYHRDPSHYGNISPFHGEMRRRVWHLIYRLEVQFSFALGLPCSVRGFQSDTRFPRNLRDEDLFADMLDLPPERPETELTPVSYSIAKSRLLAVFAAAADASHAVTPPTYSEIMDLDQRLGEAYASVPPAMRLKPLDQSTNDPPELIMNQFDMELCYQMARCVLHRTYLVKAHSDSRYDHSREACLESAMTLLQLQSTIYLACQPGGHLSSVRWYFSSLTNHDFLLAAMVVCLEMNLRHEAMMRDPQVASEGRYTCTELFQAMEKSSKIWDSYEANLIDSADTKRAGKMFRTMLSRLKSGSSTQCNGGREPAAIHYSAVPTSHFQPTPVVPSIGSEMHYMPQQHPVSMVPPDHRPPYGVAHHDQLGNMLEMPLDINWETWDRNVIPYEQYMPEPQWPLPQQIDHSGYHAQQFHPHMPYQYHS